ncbi:DUAL SPECIFICITY PROTEIN KINASE SPLA-LIKE [Salix viminalis]|uniref:DUAL SPECIFICITY PROTEIN KINASE SPLA-LIKE n=1 Tax=Salix viminalis TaxID=40686 RepID=A0A9Q0QB16_SALVM|nr:DUAL SPECIFICITY PROTEIN KINASE SPLA-LIKE [Salix viminalis]
MCSSKSRLNQSTNNIATTISKINGRPVLQPKSNQVPSLERHNSLKKNSPPKSPTREPSVPLNQPSSNAAGAKTKLPSAMSPPISPKLRSPRPPAIKRGNDPGGLNTSAEKVLTLRGTAKVTASMVKKSKKSSTAGVPLSVDTFALKYSPSMLVEAPGSIATARREQVAVMQEQRKMRIAHYGRTRSAKYQGKIVPANSPATSTFPREEKRCSFITPNSDPVYIAYHDEEWGVPVHDDKLLFELLALTGAQVGSDWTSVLKKREAFREAFSGFDAEIVAKFSEKKITSISAEYGLDISQVRGVVDNSNRILEVKREVGSFDKYLWGYVNHKPISTQYKSCQKIPVKTSKSETISKDMVKRGFRFVGPTVIHSFMQAGGLSNDHLITCPRHLQCIASASQPPRAVAPPS